MKKSPHKFILVWFAAGLAACATPAVVFVSHSYNARKIRRVAVVSVEDFPGSSGSGGIAAGIFEKYLLWADYGVVERRQVNEILNEQSLSASGSLDQATIRKVGQLLGVDALAFGTLSDFTNMREQTVMMTVPQEQTDPIYGTVTTVQHVGNTLVKTEQQVITGYNTTETDQIVPEVQTLPAHVGMSARLVDVETGEVLWSASGESDGVNLTAATEQTSSKIMQAVVKQLKAAATSASK